MVVIDWKTFAFFVCCLPYFAFADVLNLSGLQWSLRNQNGSVSVPGSVPSQVHLDLEKAGVITEPLLGTNEFTQRWVLNDNWTYTADLTPFTQNLTSERALLVFYGIDTIANITFAGQPLAWVANQFRQYVFDITHVLASNATSNNRNLTIALESAHAYGLNITSRPETLPLIFPDFQYNGIRRYIRKTQSDFGWDWGPAFVPSGVFKPAYLITLPKTPESNLTQAPQPAPHPLLVSTGSSPIFFEESSFEILKEGQSSHPTLPPNEDAPWIVNTTLYVRSSVPITQASISIEFPELGTKSGDLPVEGLGDTTSGDAKVANAYCSIPEGVPERWYPHNLGIPKLYNATITFSFVRGSSNSSTNATAPGMEGTRESVSYTVRTGFRTIQLVQTPYPQADVSGRGITPGDQWHFNVNGKAFYSSGTSVIPFDPFYARITSDKVRWILESAVLSGQNMLRVWGGGIYQPSDELTGGYDFYSACDELGLITWSELIFSDAFYPVEEFMLEEIEPEVRQNVRRVKKHPSNAQWAGGNEIEMIINVGGDLLPNVKQLKDQFQTLFGEFLHDIVYSEQSSVPYTDCSTTNGVLSLDPYVIRYTNTTPGEIYGNSERYNYDPSKAFNYDTYPVSRFVNEFGYPSMPSFYSWEEVLTSPSDYSFNSKTVVSRNHNPPGFSLEFPNPRAIIGQIEMSTAVALWLPTPSLSLLIATNHTFAQWCYSTQVFQSMNMMSEIAWYRRGAGLGENNLGALVWQMNDVWQAPTWSAVEYSGRWKALNYGMSKAFSPLAVYPFWTPANESLEVRVMSDRWEETKNVRVDLTWFDWKGNEISKTTKSTDVPPLNGTIIWSAQGLQKEILPEGKFASEVWLSIELTGEVDGKTILNDQVFTPVSLGQISLPNPQLNLTHTSDLTFTVSAHGGVAAWTWLDHPAGTIGYFVDVQTNIPTNGFYLIPGRDRTVRFVLNQALSKVQTPDPSQFVVRSLWDNTYD
ncbi:glycoside hydrolase family 2 protein [Panus rudis PR-1116 ss-1]|nr:glycoside hydrolase family 2 protein [Panus rudis PR-1116 ss-1]